MDPWCFLVVRCSPCPSGCLRRQQLKFSNNSLAWGCGSSWQEGRWAPKVFGVLDCGCLRLGFFSVRPLEDLRISQHVSRFALLLSSVPPPCTPCTLPSRFAGALHPQGFGRSWNDGKSLGIGITTYRSGASRANFDYPFALRNLPSSSQHLRQP
jgi:hypothetical protein